MVRILDRNVKVWHLLVLGLLLGLVVGGGIGVAASPAAQFAGGTVRLASAWSDQSVAITGTGGPESLKRVLRTSITVPSGHVADVQTSFTATLLPNSISGTFAFCSGRFTLDSQSNLDPQFRPGQMQLIGGPWAAQPNAIAVAMNGFRKNIGPGTHYVNVYVSSAFQGCTLQERALNVVVNIH